MPEIKRGDKVVLFGTWLGMMLPAKSGEVINPGAKVEAGMPQIVHIKLDNGEIVQVPVTHVHIPT